MHNSNHKSFEENEDALRFESLNRYTKQRLKNVKTLNFPIKLCHEGKFSKAYDMFKSQLDTKKKDPIYWNHLGTCYLLEKKYPKAGKLRPFFIGLLIISIISWLFTFGQNNDNIALISPNIASVLDKIDLLSNIVIILNIVILSLSVYMTILFDDFLIIDKPTTDIINSNGDSSKTESEDEL